MTQERRKPTKASAKQKQRDREVAAAQELILQNECTFESIEHDIRIVLGRMEKDKWEIGRLLSLGRALCTEDDCGIEGDNPNQRFGNWVSLNFSGTLDRTSAYNYRRLFETFGQQKDRLVEAKVPVSDLYKLCKEDYSDYRTKMLERIDQAEQPKQEVKAIIGDLKTKTLRGSMLHDEKSMDEVRDAKRELNSTLSDTHSDPNRQKKWDAVVKAIDTYGGSWGFKHSEIAELQKLMKGYI